MSSQHANYVRAAFCTLLQRLRIGLAVLGLVGHIGFAATANAERPPLPSTPPGDYIMEAKGDVRWVYPETAQGEVQKLQTLVPSVRLRLQAAFGTDDSDDLDIRVALQPEDMAALAPGHHVPDYAQGVAYPEQGLILLTFSAPFTFGRPDMAQVLVHELSHVALHRAVNGRPIPRWFTEGVAIDQAEERSLDRLRVLWEGTLRKQLLPLDDLSRSFPSHHGDVNVAYAQSADLVRHLLDDTGDHAHFKQLLELLREGSPFPQAIQAAYGVSLSYIEREWRNSLLRSFGRWPSLLSGLTALWALTALLLFVGYVRTRRRHHRTLQRWQEEEAAQQQAPQPPNFPVAMSVPPPPDSTTQATHRLDALMDRFQRKASPQGDVPTIEHDGQNHTLH